ncbi:C-type lectin domain family 10 member A-like [Crassostrea virginica]
MNFIKILGVMLHFPFLVKLETRISSFQSDSNYFEDVLPLNEGAYISPMLNCKFFKCAINCMAIALCDAFLFNPLTSDCWILRCPLNGLKVVPNNGWMYYHRPNGCDVGWSRFESHCYLYNETTVSWQDAKMFCESQGAYLLEVESQQEMDWVTEKLLKTGIQLKKKTFCELQGGYLIEVNDKAENDWMKDTILLPDICAQVQFCSTWNGAKKTENGTYYWLHSNTRVENFFWEPNEPAGNGDECINMRPSGKWNDALCTTGQFWILCEKSA